MLVISAPLAAVGLTAVVYLGLIFFTLSERLNAVANRPDHHRWFWVANGLIAIAAASQAIRSTASLAPQHAFAYLLEPWFSLVTFHIPLAVGATIDLLLVWYYWGWILRE
ncbi:MAG: hypothetical protein PVF54_10610 [Anaerolineae bacterium]|jgi:hypothetical protein